MNPISNLGVTMIKEVQYSAALMPTATTINFTVENCHVNAFIEDITIYLSTSEPSFASLLSCNILDRGNGYPLSINGVNPVTFMGISSANTTIGGSNASNWIEQNGQVVTIQVNQSVQDSEGIGNIYVQLSKLNGTFNQSFTMVVTYRPEATYNPKFNNRNQISNNKPRRVLSQLGLGSYAAATSTMVDQTNFSSPYVNPRNNVDTLPFGFNVSSASPYFYFGTPYPQRRWFLGFSSDNTPYLGIVTFSYFNGTAFQGFGATQVYNGCQGPGTYAFANDGVIYFMPPPTWQSLTMANDPLTIYNNTMIGLGTLRTNEVVNNPQLYWIQCQVGFASTASIKISTVVPLIDPDQPLTFRRRIF